MYFHLFILCYGHMLYFLHSNQGSKACKPSLEKALCSSCGWQTPANTALGMCQLSLLLPPPPPSTSTVPVESPCKQSLQHSGKASVFRPCVGLVGEPIFLHHKFKEPYLPGSDALILLADESVLTDLGFKNNNW